jgi:hypothetical protein
MHSTSPAPTGRRAVAGPWGEREREGRWGMWFHDRADLKGLASLGVTEGSMRGGGGLEEGRRRESVIGSRRRGADGGAYAGLVGDLPYHYYAWATTGNFTRGGGWEWEWELGGNELR